MKFFLDNNLSPRYARALNELEGPDGSTVKRNPTSKKLIIPVTGTKFTEI